MADMHDHSERRYFIAHRSFSDLMETWIGEGLVAYDTETGTLLWTSPALGGTIRGGHSMYQIGGRQYVLVAVSGDTPPAGQWPKQDGVTPPSGFIAFALPESQ